MLLSRMVILSSKMVMLMELVDAVVDHLARENLGMSAAEEHLTAVDRRMEEIPQKKNRPSSLHFPKEVNEKRKLLLMVVDAAPAMESLAVKDDDSNSKKHSKQQRELKTQLRIVVVVVAAVKKKKKKTGH